MMRFFSGSFTAVLAAVLAVSLTLRGAPALAGKSAAPAAEKTAAAPGFRTKAKYAILIDSRSGKAYFEKNADALMSPASMSKILTLVVVFEMLKKGVLSEDDEIEISENAWRKGGAASGSSTMFAPPGTREKLGVLIRAIVIASANDAAIAVAESIAGSEEAFAALMTRRARELGLEKSTFVNATGLPDPKHKMTARELAQLTRYLIEVFPDYYKLFSEKVFEWGGHRQYNRDPLLGRYPGADGVKTGHTKESGYGMVASAVRDGRRLIAVLNGMKSKKERAAETRKLLDWGFRQFRPVVLYGPGETVGYARVWGGVQDTVPLMAKDTSRARLSEEERRAADAEIVYSGPLRAPVRRGDAVAKLRIRLDGRTIAYFPLYAAKSVDPTDNMWAKAFGTLKFWIFGG